jgi:hypothetical protein
MVAVQMRQFLRKFSRRAMSMHMTLKRGIIKGLKETASWRGSASWRGAASWRGFGEVVYKLIRLVY